MDSTNWKRVAGINTSNTGLIIRVGIIRVGIVRPIGPPLISILLGLAF